MKFDGDVCSIACYKDQEKLTKNSFRMISPTTGDANDKGKKHKKNPPVEL